MLVSPPVVVKELIVILMDLEKYTFSPSFVLIS